MLFLFQRLPFPSSPETCEVSHGTVPNRHIGCNIVFNGRILFCRKGGSHAWQTDSNGPHLYCTSVVMRPNTSI